MALQSTVTVVHLKAPNDTNGNPRRLFVLLDRGDIIGVVNEGYEGEGVLDMIYGKGLRERIAMRIPVSAAVYSETRKMARRRNLSHYG